MKVLDTIIMVGYFLLIFAIGIFGAKKASSSEDFAVAGRRLGLPMYTGCIIAVVLGGASTIGSTGLGYQYGISGAWLVFMLGLGLVLIAVFFIEKIVNLKVLTISEFLERRFDSKAQWISAIVAAIYALMVSATQIISLGTILQSILGWDPKLSMLVVGCLVFAYTVLGGMWALTMTDFIHFIIITVGILFLLLPFSIHQVGGIDKLISEIPESYLSVSAIGWDTIFQYFLLYGLGVIIGQDIWQRVFTAKDTKTAKRGTVLAGIYSMVYGVAVAIIGMCAFIALPQITNSQTVFSQAAIDFLPPGITGIVLAAVVAALMSTASGTLLASATLLTNDLFAPYLKKRKQEFDYVKTTRWITAVLGGVAILVAILVGNIISALNIAYSFLTGTLFVPIIAAFFLKKVTAKTVTAGILVSFMAVLVSLIIFTPDSLLPILIGIAINVVIIVCSFLFPQKTSENKK
ncbi:SSS family solute:Na+ symporter [Enterococcus sp. PF1-24]|uniref:sodium:solute symporter n=1 Tax=unclassified Enterococcus TaxID=2608891 RepID=UPI002474A34E|nr:MULTISPECIES: sodium:solute symporter [unclassified Enterococcus]MDH6365356.1 SSS family solute:Na+ symporter [Enterococcus sp. PFB1-1]MDH6402457.1 SSS family solute:Na+ symporter [Enterococcus sp. PF1-24]